MATEGGVTTETPDEAVKVEARTSDNSADIGKSSFFDRVVLPFPLVKKEGRKNLFLFYFTLRNK